MAHDLNCWNCGTTSTGSAAGCTARSVKKRKCYVDALGDSCVSAAYYEYDILADCSVTNESWTNGQGAAITKIQFDALIPSTCPDISWKCNQIAPVNASDVIGLTAFLNSWLAGVTLPATQISGLCAAVAACAPPVTGTISPVPAVFPLVWTVDGVTYPTVAAFQAALEAVMGVSLTYDPATFTFTAPAGSVFPSLVLTPVPVTNSGVLSQCPVSFPVLFNGSLVADLAALTSAVQAFYAVTASYNATTCTYTKTGGAGSLTPIIPVEGPCNFSLVGGSVTNNGGVTVFRSVLANPATLVPAGFTTFNDNAGTLISLLRLASGTQCGINFNVAVNDNSGTLVGYGAAL